MVKLNIIGNVGSVKLYQAEGKPSVLNFDVASNRRVGGKEQTDWVACKVWYERAEKLADHVTTGTLLFVEGRPEARAYKRTDGSIATELVLHATEVVFLSGKKNLGEQAHEGTEDHNDDDN